MRKILSAFIPMFMALGVGAQVTVELILDQEQFLRSESLPVRLKISNFSGLTLRR